MKRIVFALGIVDILIGVVLALMCIASNVLTALLILAVAILLSIPFFALAQAMEQIEELREKLWQLHGRLNRLSTAEAADTTAPKEPPLPGGRKALVNWTCQKCGAGNKTGTNRCDNCGAAY